MKTLLLSSSLLFALFTGANCGEEGGAKSCTLIGCQDQIEVRHPLPVAGAYRLEVRMAGLSWEADCPGHDFDQAIGLSCDERGFTLVKAPEEPWGARPVDTPTLELDYMVEQGGRAREASVRSTWVGESRPNGEGCGPLCTQRESSVEADTW